jgi:hypothetical protein
MGKTKLSEISNDNVNLRSEQSVVVMLDNLFSDIAYLDPDVVRHNIEQACNGGMPLSDRSIRLELANYFFKHFAVIYFGLIISPDVRDAFMSAVQAEIGLDSVDAGSLKEIRDAMKSNSSKQKKPSKGNYVIDFSVDYNDNIYKIINKRIYDSMMKFEDFDDMLNEFAIKLSREDMIHLGFIFSNFMYLIRALIHNGLFVDYIKTFVQETEEQVFAK